MPGFDRSGPLGEGPMSGGARGICGRGGNRKTRDNHYQSDQYGPGCRRGIGGRRGRTMEPRVEPKMPGVDSQSLQTQNHKKEVFDNQLSQIQQSLSNIGQRLDALEKQS